MLHSASHDATRNSRPTTLLALVQALTDAGGSDQEVVDRAITELESGRAHLIGNFRDMPLDAVLGRTRATSSA
jgi:hypothetical protein